MKAFLIPGSGEDLNSRDYQAVLSAYKDAGYEPEFVAIDWKYKTIDHWAEEVRRRLKDGINNALLSGFSFGAMIALTVAAEMNPKSLLLFSVSPYFKEDMPLDPRYVKWAGQRRIKAFERLSFNQLAEQIHCPTTIFLGDQEKRKYKDMWHRSNEARRRIKHSELVLVKSAGHDVGDRSYVAAINKAVQNKNSLA
jgi:esterase/lipase